MVFRTNLDTEFSLISSDHIYIDMYELLTLIHGTVNGKYKDFNQNIKIGFSNTLPGRCICFTLLDG